MSHLDLMCLIWGCSTSSMSLEAVKQTTPVQSPSTLPAHFTPSPSSVKPAVYGKPHMTADNYPGLAQSCSELGASTGLLLAVLHLGLSLVRLHQNVAERVYDALDLGRVLGLHHTVSQVQVSATLTPSLPAQPLQVPHLLSPPGFV